MLQAPWVRNYNKAWLCALKRKAVNVCWRHWLIIDRSCQSIKTCRNLIWFWNSTSFLLCVFTERLREEDELQHCGLKMWHVTVSVRIEHCYRFYVVITVTWHVISSSFDCVARSKHFWSSGVVAFCVAISCTRFHPVQQIVSVQIHRSVEAQVFHRSVQVPLQFAWQH